MRVILIGAAGFVGSAFARLLSRQDVDLVEVTRPGYDRHAGTAGDLVIDAAGNSKKFLAEGRPFEEFDLSVAHRLRTLRDFPAPMHVHISSVDVYRDLTAPEATSEDTPVGPENPSHYGFHKALAEQVVRHHARRWLVLRLAGMVGPGLRKNPVHDILSGNPLRIHPDSRYQFMPTDAVAGCAWELIRLGVTGETFNVCGAGLISPSEVADLAGREPDLSLLGPDERPRVVHIDTAKIARHLPMPDTRSSVAEFLSLSDRGRRE
jgi:nucleoside-diphosphate-sugar epimerase